MGLPFDFAALPPEVNTERLLFGPGSVPTVAAATAYAALATQLRAAAANTEGMMANMSGSWQSLSADQAQAAFQKHVAWLNAQATVATTASLLIDWTATAYQNAAGAMAVVAAELAENKAEEAALLSTTAIAAAAGPIPALVVASTTVPLLAENEAEYLAIWGQAVAVMASYAGAVVPTLEALPEPMTPPPIVGGGGGPTDPGAGPVQMLSGGPVPGTPGGGSPSSGGGSFSGGSDDPGGGAPSDSFGNSTGPDAGPQGPGGGPSGSGPSDPVGLDPAGPTGPQGTPAPMPGYSVDGGYGVDGSAPELGEGFYGTSPSSPTLAGLTGGVGSSVALSMTRGGLGAMSGASTGFRMPQNWNPATTKAFGAKPVEPTPGPVQRRTAPRGATAPELQMRRRRDEDKKKESDKVFVPGEPVDVPVLERAPVVGVIEFDGDHRDEPVPELPLAVGVIEGVEDDAVLASPDRPR